MTTNNQPAIRNTQKETTVTTRPIPSEAQPPDSQPLRHKPLPLWLAPHAEEVRGWGPVVGIDVHCWVTGCERSVHLHGLCRRHYFRARERYRSGPVGENPALRVGGAR